MPENHYTNERHTQILIALLKKHGIRNIIASPGTTNICFVGSIQSDPFFKIYSSVDERSAAFIACGMAAESGEPVAIACTGSTASRNYAPGLTEAYYRHLPVLAITASQHLGRAGNLYPQFIDRSQRMNDMVNESVCIEPVYSPEDIWSCESKVNKALLALKANGGGPAHINLVTTYSLDFSVKELPTVKAVSHIDYTGPMPDISAYKRIAILVGVHGKWNDRLTNVVDTFCEKYNAVVLMNHAANYKGNFALIQSMKDFINPLSDADLVIYFGSVARYPSGMRNAEMWRISLDGKASDPEKKLTKVFQMDEAAFFSHYTHTAKSLSHISRSENGYARQWQKQYDDLIKRIPALPFSNVWIAKTLSGKLPGNSVLHIAGSNTARSWNFFQLPKSIECYSNDGTMGIDGQVSALIGESLASPARLHFGVVGDLTFFYDMNVLGNRHIGKNVRLLLVNNGKGAEFKLYTHHAYAFGEQGDAYMAAAGHFGNQSPNLVRHYAEDLGYEYLCAKNKEEFLKKVQRFIIPGITDKSMIFEVFTNTEDENNAVYIMNHLVKSTAGVTKRIAKDVIHRIAGDEGVDTVKKLLGR